MAAVTLSDINKTLQEQTLDLGEKQAQTSQRVDSLAKGFNAFFDMIKNAEEEDARSAEEAKREISKTRSDASTSVGRTKSAKNGGGFFDFDVGNLLPLAGAFLSGMIKRGIPAILATVLADEIAEAVTKLTGSQILGSISEWATIGGAAGFLVGGLKGGIIGAILGTVFSDGVRDSIATKLNDLLDTELKKDDWQTLAISGGLAAAGLSLPKLIGLMAGKLMPFFLGPKGLLVALSIAIGGLIVAYATDEEFRKDVNKALAPMFMAITDALTSVKDWIKNKINEFLPSFVTTSAEDRAIREEMSKSEAGQKLLREEANIKGQISEITGSRIELEGISNTDIDAMKALAKRLGIDELYGDKVDSYTRPMLLKEDLKNTLLAQQGRIAADLKRAGGFNEMYDAIERQLEKEVADKIQAKRDAELKAKYETTPLVKGSETANIQETYNGTQALGSWGDMFRRADEKRRAALNKNIPPATASGDLSKVPTGTTMTPIMEEYIKSEVNKTRGGGTPAFTSQTIDQSVNNAGDTNVMGFQWNSGDPGDNIWGKATP